MPRYTATMLESDLEDIIGGVQEYAEYLDLAACQPFVEGLQKLIHEAEQAQDSDHEDDETTEDEDEDLDDEDSELE